MVYVMDSGKHNLMQKNNEVDDQRTQNDIAMNVDGS